MVEKSKGVCVCVCVWGGGDRKMEYCKDEMIYKRSTVKVKYCNGEISY